jgi:hypothetical protein
MTGVEELLESAHSALRAGNSLVARGYLRRAVRLEPDRLDVWRELLAVTELPADRLRCLERIVELDPSDIEAKERLDQLRIEVDDGDPDVDGETTTADPPPGNAAEAAGTASADGTSEQPARPVLIDMRQDITDEMRRQWDEAVAAGRPLHCIDHPQRETALRCNRCGAPVCTDCIVRTPVGFRCKECIKAQQAVFFNAQWYDYPIAALISFGLSIPAAVMASVAGWWFAMIISPLAGGLIGGIVHWAIGRRRGRWIWLLVSVCVVIGALVALTLVSLRGSFALISIGIYAATAAGAAIGVLRLGRRR